jgi:hypothetical protein
MPNMSFCDLLEYSGSDAVYLKELLRVMRGNGDTRFRTVSKLVRHLRTETVDDPQVKVINRSGTYRLHGTRFKSDVQRPVRYFLESGDSNEQGVE